MHLVLLLLRRDLVDNRVDGAHILQLLLNGVAIRRRDLRPQLVQYLARFRPNCLSKLLIERPRIVNRAHLLGVR